VVRARRDRLHVGETDEGRALGLPLVLMAGRGLPDDQSPDRHRLPARSRRHAPPLRPDLPGLAQRRAGPAGPPCRARTPGGAAPPALLVRRAARRRSLRIGPPVRALGRERRPAVPRPDRARAGLRRDRRRHPLAGR
jgi:hypothetical protein